MVLRLRTQAVAVVFATSALMAGILLFTDVADAASGTRQSAGSAPRTNDSAWQTSPPQAKFFTINAVLAKLDRGIKPGEPVRFAAADPGGGKFDPPAGIPSTDTFASEPFGLLAFRAPEGTLWRKWRPIQVALEVEAEQIETCTRDIATCQNHIARFARLIQTARSKEGIDKIREVNEAVNQSIRYVSDYNQWGLADRWSAPLDTFASGQGDCEDYAIAKYALLRAAGIKTEDLKIVLVRDRAARADHAVLATRHDGKWLILDNRHNRLVADRDSNELMPLFALNDTGVSLFAVPYTEHKLGFETGDMMPATAEWGGESVPVESGAPYSGSGNLMLMI